MPPLPLSPRAIRALSAEADVAPATVQRRLEGRPVRPSTCERIERAAQKLAMSLPPRIAPALTLAPTPATSRAPGAPEAA